MKKLNKLFIIIPILLIVIICVSFIIIHSNNNKFRYKIYDSSDFDYKIMDKGYYYEELGGDIYHYVITSGEKTTGGYSIEIDSVTKNEDNIKVVVHETSSTGIATTAFTYPYVILELYEKPANIKIVDDYGNSFRKLN